MDHADHVTLIRAAVEGAASRWLELGAGEGAFTLALAELLGETADITALDRDAGALRRLATRFAAQRPVPRVATAVADFTSDLPAGPFDGVLAANSLHFVRDRDRRAVLAAIRAGLGPHGRLVVVEYDADHGNPWVPHPFSFATWRREAVAAGFAEPRLAGRVPSRFLGAMYAAVTEPLP